MTVVYVDTEHERVLRDPARAGSHAARLETAQERLASASGRPCLTVRYEKVSPRSLAPLAPSTIVISGCMSDWDDYDFSTFEGLFEVIRSASVPILGICAGHQLIGFAHGASWGPLGPLQPGETDPDPSFAPGLRKERGFHPVDADADCLLFREVGRRPQFFQSHYWELKEVPAGFMGRASSAISAIQAIECRDRPMFGVEFHPERFDAEHPDGEVLLRNFFASTSPSRKSWIRG
jgi:GMP synthase-like glutamine amidotransferase